MMGYVYLAAFEGCGAVISSRLLRRYGKMTQLWMGLCLGLIMLMWFPSLFAFGMKFSASAHWCALGAAIACACAAAFIPQKERERLTVTDAHEPPLWLVLAVTLPLTAVMAYMQYTHVIRPEAGALMTGQSTYGDLNLHLGIATGLVNAEYPPEYTILPGTLLGYPFLMDAMSGSLYLMGMGLRWAFIIPGVLMSALVFWGFVMLAWEMTHDARSVLLASALLFFNGGLGFIYVIDGALGDPSAWNEVFTGFYKAPANLVDHNIRWVNVLVDMMLPQRTLLAGWTVVIPALWLLLRCMREKDTSLFIMLGVWAGAMPMIHTHSFLALGIISAAVLLCTLWNSRREAMGIYFTIQLGLLVVCAGAAVLTGSVFMALPSLPIAAWMAVTLFNARREKGFSQILNFLIYGGIAVALALPQLLTWTFPQTVGGGSLAIRPNWVNWNGSGLIDEYFWFWIKNVGLVYLVMWPAGRFAGKRGKMFALGALLIYVIAEFIQFQPNPYDNNKLFYVAFIVMLPLCARYLIALYEKIRELPGRRILACAFIVVSLLSGVLSVVRECVSEYQLYGASEVRAVEFLKEESGGDAVVLTGTQHNNPVSSIGGMKIVCGTSSFLYYHGVDYYTEERAVRSMFEQPRSSEALFEKYGVDYIYISSSERYNYAIDYEAISEKYPLIYDDGVYIYAVSGRAQAAAERME